MHAVDIVHYQIGDDDIEAILFDGFGTFRTTGGHCATKPDAFETFRHSASVGSVVVNDQDGEFTRIKASLSFVE